MALNYRRGSTAIQEAATKKSGGGFRPFIPQIQWRNDGESKYVLVVTNMDEVATLLLHSFIPVGKGEKSNGEEYTRYEEFLSRKDIAIGESYDELEDRLEREPKNRCLGIMVELDPILEGKKVKGFTVKTENFTRKTDDGEVDTTAPVIGLCTQSAMTLWGAIDSAASEFEDITEVPLRITRRGKDQNTRYDILPFMDKTVDLSPVVEYLDGISYIGDDLDDLITQVDAEDSDAAKVQVIASFLLEKRIDELADSERYEELVTPLKLEDMPKNPWGRKASGSKGSSSAKAARPGRRTAQEAAREEAETSNAPSAEAIKNERFAKLKERVEQG